MDDAAEVENRARAILGRCGDQRHLFEGWNDSDGADVEKKQLFFAKIVELDAKYPGGLAAYCTRAGKLLAAAREGANPFEGCAPEVPSAACTTYLSFASKEFMSREEIGIGHVSKCAFVLVAGGLGERLGYSGIKVSLPTELTTGTTYLALYARHILSLQQRCGEDGAVCPLAIMTSMDTHDKTVALLEENDYFGLEKSQVTLMMQDKVAALEDDGTMPRIARKSTYEIQTKPHGHGDVHYLLHRTGLVDSWRAEGRKWVVFF